MVPIPPGTKNPTKPGWNILENTIQTEEDAKFWLEHPDWNMGLLLSESRMVALDIDNLQNTQTVFNELGLNYEELLKGAPRIIGRPGRDKALFAVPKNEDTILSRKTLSWENKETRKSEVVFELRAGAIQDVLPPSIHPDTQLPYKWKSYPSDGIPEIPKQLLTIWKEWDKFKPQFVNACPWGVSQPPPPPIKIRSVNKSSEDIIGKYNASHNIESLLEKYGYKRKTATRYLSPYSTSGLAGVVVYPNENKMYSHHASEPFDSSHSLDAFGLFCHFEHKENITDAVREAANEMNEVKKSKTIINIDRPPGKKKNEKGNLEYLYKSTSLDMDTPEHLLCVPGILQDVVDYFNTTSRKYQPQFAVQTALAVGSTVMGRRFVTSQENYSSLYLIVVGDSSTGKEHIKDVTEQLFICSDLPHLIGPSGYTSSGGLFTHLTNSPTHLCVMDELGRLLQSSKKSQNSNGMDAQTSIMEVFGRLGSVHRPPGYSTMTLSQKQKADIDPNRFIMHPALSIIAMTTPSTLYDSLSSDYITSGFIPRFIIVETELGRRKGRKIQKAEPSSRLISWMRKCATANKKTNGNLEDVDGPKNPPEPLVISFNPGCEPLLDYYEDTLLSRMEKHKNDKMDVMYGKTQEIAMRVSLIVAASCNSNIILPEHLKWAIEYVDYYTEQAVSKLKQRISDSGFEAVCKDVYELIKESDDIGMTERELSRSSVLYRGFNIDDRKKIMKTLHEDYGIELCDINHKGAGRTRTAWVTEEIVSKNETTKPTKNVK